MKSVILAVSLCFVPVSVSLTGTSSSVVAQQRTEFAPPPASEHSWAMRETLADIQEMAGKAVSTTEAQVWSMLAWTPNASLVAFAAAQFGPAVAMTEVPLRDQYPALLQASTAQLFAANDEVSQALKHNLRNPRAHEAAALILGAFGLQEAAGSMTDHRWVMNRMTAHLAVAAALRRASPVSVDGQLASATLDALAGRQAAALETLARLGDPLGDSPRAAWQRGLLMRIKQDWRVLNKPAAATRLEKLEYLRARRHMITDRRAAMELDQLNEPDAADFARIVQSFAYDVQDGNQFVADGMVRELKALARLYQQQFGRPLPEPMHDAVNKRAGRLMASGSPVVLPWGAWAEFSQRHLAMAIADTDQHYRRTLDLPDQADELNEAMDGVLRGLRMFSIATINRGVADQEDERDRTYLHDALGLLSTAPELIPMSYWKTMETAAEQAFMPRRIPSRKTWFIDPSADVPYDVGRRLADAVIPYGTLRALIDASPYNAWLLWRAADSRSPLADLRARADALIQERAAYDLWALDRQVAASSARLDWEKHLRRGCELSPARCITLATRLAPTDEHAAAVEYQRAFDDPALDGVTRANSSEWLVFYYERNNEPHRARGLAESAAKAGSQRGIRTLARLLERRGEVEHAGKLFEAIVERYPSRTDTLAGFLYRRAVVHNDTRFTKRWEEIRQRVFPNGLSPQTTVADRPAAGVYVHQDRPSSERLRLQIGDIIVGVDGWRVDNIEQFNTVLAFSDQLNTHRITAWRGVLFTASVPTSHELKLDSYPVKGWTQ
jgi:hypothetical protein